MCGKHLKYEATLFCFSCDEEWICIQCLVEGLHPNHEVAEREEAVQILA